MESMTGEKQTQTVKQNNKKTEERERKRQKDRKTGNEIKWKK